MASNSKWTDEEMKIIVGSEKLTFREICDLLPGRTRQAVRRQLWQSKARYVDTRGSRPWKAEDVSYLMKNHGKKTTKQIAAHLGKSIAAVTRQCNKMGIKVIPRAGGGPNGGQVIRHWTEEEKKKLFWYSSTMSIAQLAEVFGRSKDSISCQILAMGINRTQGTYNVHAVAEMLGVHYGTVIRYRNLLGQKWSTHNKEYRTIEPGADLEQIQEIARAILDNPRTMTQASARHLRMIAEGDPLEYPESVAA